MFARKNTYMQIMNMGPPSGDAFDKSSTSCTNLQNSDAELGTTFLLSHPVYCRWGIVRAGTFWNKRFIWNKYLFWKRYVYFCLCLTQLTLSMCNVREVQQKTL